MDIDAWAKHAMADLMQQFRGDIKRAAAEIAVISNQQKR
jgi:hypothetical protein